MTDPPGSEAYPEPREIRPDDMSPEDRARHEKLVAEPGIQMISQIVRLKDEPRLLILVAHGFVELMVNALIDNKLKNAKRITSDGRGFPHSTKLLLLHEVGVLDDEQYRVFSWFRKLRNRAAHEPLFELTPQDLKALRAPHSDPEHFHQTIQSLVLGYWNQHVELFGRVFIPSLHDSPAPSEQ